MAKALRQDITGLRAIAVLAVTLFHIDHVMLPNVDAIKGGFLGVDIFFVISGFLMTMIIMRGLDAGNFSVFYFYKRRAKRICPALVTTIIFFLLLGCLTIGSKDLETAGREASKALLFVSNHYFASRTGYFDEAATERMFLHTWSLSVEWQFYIIYPFVLILAKRFISNEAIGRLLLGLTIVLLIFACVYTSINSNNSYYLLPSRAFELLFGALAYFYPLSFFQGLNAGIESKSVSKSKDKWSYKVSELAQKISPSALEATGLVIIVISLFVVSNAEGWPNITAVPPLFGTYLCIAAGNHKSHLRWGVFQKLGLWSFAIYLVHWPLIVFINKFDSLNNAALLGLLLTIFALGALMHYSIERRRNYGYKFLGLYTVIIFASLGIAKDGLPWRVNHPEIEDFAQYGGNFANHNGQAQHIGNLDRPVDLIISGDSYARQYSSDMIERGLHIVSVCRDGCYSYRSHFAHLEGCQRTKEPCRVRYDNLIQAAKESPEAPVMIAQNWTRYSEDVQRRSDDKRLSDLTEEQFGDLIRGDLAELAADLKGHDLYILGRQRYVQLNSGRNCFFMRRLDNPIGNILSHVFSCQEQREPSEKVPLNTVLEETVKQLQASNAIVDENGKGSITYIDPSAVYCDEDSCLISTTDNLPIFSDADHFSWAGSIPINNYMLDIMGIEKGKQRTSFIDNPHHIPPVEIIYE